MLRRQVVYTEHSYRDIIKFRALKREKPVLFQVLLIIKTRCVFSPHDANCHRRMAFRLKPGDKSAGEERHEFATELILSPELCDYVRAKRELPWIPGMPLQMGREEKLPSALGRQVGRQAGRYWALYFHKLIFTRQYTRSCSLLYGPRKYSGPPGIGWQGGRVLFRSPLLHLFALPSLPPFFPFSLFGSSLSAPPMPAYLHPAQRHKSPPIVNNTRRMLISISTFRLGCTYIRTRIYMHTHAVKREFGYFCQSCIYTMSIICNILFNIGSIYSID